MPLGKSALRGVGSCGLDSDQYGTGQMISQIEVIPLVNMKVLRKIGSEARRGRRTSNRFHAEVVWVGLLHGSLHGEISEIEAVCSKGFGSRKRGIGWRSICSEATMTDEYWRLHGRQR